MTLQSKLKNYLDVVIVFIVMLVIPALAPLLVTLAGTAASRAFVRYAIYILMAAVPVVVCLIRKQPVFVSCGFRRDGILKQMISALPVFAATAAVFVVLPLLFGVPRTMVLSQKYTDPVEIVLRVIQYMIFVGPVEELIFRGYLFERLKTLTKSGVWTVVLTSLGFGFWHFPSTLDIVHVLITALIGLILGFARLRLKNCSTLSVSLAHGLHDTLIMVLSCLLLP